jgi:predicted DNA-binding transcriptional regulator YafY
MFPTVADRCCPLLDEDVRMPDPSSRMLRLLSLLQVGREWAGTELAARLDVSERTVRRDVARLRELGYRVDALRGPSGGYRLSAGSELPPLLFDDEQAVAVALALAVAPASGADIAEAAARALATVRQSMPSRLRHRIDAVEVAPARGSVVVDPDVLVAVSGAVRRHEVLRFDYGSRPGAASGSDARDRPPRRVEPHAVVARDGRWYLLAWDDDARPDGGLGAEAGGSGAEGAARGDWRIYRIDRLSPREPTRRSFVPRPIPGGDAAAFVAARFKGSAVDDAWPCRGTAVVALPTRRIAPFLDADATAEAVDADRTAVTQGSWSWGALAARFAGFDAAFEVVGPDELREAATDLADRLAASVGGRGRRRALSAGRRARP